jgi:hypothetical protein
MSGAQGVLDQVELLSASLVADDEQIDQGDQHRHGDEAQAEQPVNGEPDAAEVVAEEGLAGEQEEQRGGQEDEADHAAGSKGRIRHESKVMGTGTWPKGKSERLQGC